MGGWQGEREMSDVCSQRYSCHLSDMWTNQHHLGSGDDVDEVYIDHQNHFYKSPGQHLHNHDKFDHLCWSSVPRCPAYQWTIEEWWRPRTRNLRDPPPPLLNEESSVLSSMRNTISILTMRAEFSEELAVNSVQQNFTRPLSKLMWWLWYRGLGCWWCWGC